MRACKLEAASNVNQQLLKTSSSPNPRVFFVNKASFTRSEVVPSICSASEPKETAPIPAARCAGLESTGRTEADRCHGFEGATHMPDASQNPVFEYIIFSLFMVASESCVFSPKEKTGFDGRLGWCGAR